MPTLPDSYADDEPSSSGDLNCRIEVLCVDMNGIPRGKWLPATQRDKVFQGELRLPLSTQSLDIWGDDNDALTGLSQSIGDPDGQCIADRRSWTPLCHAPGHQVLVTLHEADGMPSFLDPRAMLSDMVARFRRLGWTPVVAIELEFYLIDPAWRSGGALMPPSPLCPGGRLKGLQLYELDAMQALAEVLEDIQHHAHRQALPVDTLIAEFGPGQFEINLLHRPDALAAADDALYLKRVIDQTAQRHGLDATFMAKPYSEHAGSGMHLHVSLIDDDGRNLFDASHHPGHLESAVAGLIVSLQQAQAVFAPHANSYRRFQPDSFAPVDCSWGWGHRGAAIRIPERHGPGARLEHRVAGADANPYLALSAILGGMLHGLEGQLVPPDSIAPGRTCPKLTHDWLQAIECFADSPLMADIFGERYRDLFAAIKRHEARRLFAQVTDIDRHTYLTRL